MEMEAEPKIYTPQPPIVENANITAYMHRKGLQQLGGPLPLEL